MNRQEKYDKWAADTYARNAREAAEDGQLAQANPVYADSAEADDNEDPLQAIEDPAVSAEEKKWPTEKTVFQVRGPIRLVRDSDGDTGEGGGDDDDDEEDEDEDDNPTSRKKQKQRKPRTAVVLETDDEEEEEEEDEPVARSPVIPPLSSSQRQRDWEDFNQGGDYGFPTPPPRRDDQGNDNGPPLPLEEDDDEKEPSPVVASAPARRPATQPAKDSIVISDSDSEAAPLPSVLRRALSTAPRSVAPPSPPRSPRDPGFDGFGQTDEFGNRDFGD